ncbi:MAG TPA: gfo/Idh/MocA family oxidoreductase, partial [Pseudonocardiaceae bacterium]|nr:gfo/Idh/MocA family oxidoreductase [Pseudonocardiaceae bacterium]
RTLLDLPVEQRSRLQPGLTYRHDPAMAVLSSWIENRELGTPLLIRAHIYGEPRRDGDSDADDSDYRRRILATMAHGSPIIHEGAHVLDWLTYLMGAAAEHITDAWCLRTEDHLRNPNITGARLSWADGSVALVEIGWWTGAQPHCEIGVLGQVGYAVLDCATFRLERHTAAGTEVVEFPGDRTSRCFDRQLARFVELIRGDRSTAEPGLDDAVATLELLERIVATAEDVSTPDARHGDRR